MNTNEELNRIESKINNFGLGYGLFEIYMAVILWWYWGSQRLMPGDTNIEFFITLGGIIVLGRVLNIFRKKYIVPRTGYLKRANFNKRELLKGLYVIPLSLILAVPILITEIDHRFVELATFTETFMSLIMGIAFALYIYLVSLVGNFGRLKYYGFLLGATFAIRQFYPISFDHLRIFWSLLLLISGGIQLNRFLKNNPVGEPDVLEGFSEERNA